MVHTHAAPSIDVFWLHECPCQSSPHLQVSLQGAGKCDGPVPNAQSVLCRILRNVDGGLRKGCRTEAMVKRVDLRLEGWDGLRGGQSSSSQLCSATALNDAVQQLSKMPRVF